MLDAYVRKYLEPAGWIRSRELGRCVDRHGCPVPWYTYPAIRMIGHLAKRSHRVFEYGCGNSSLWWRERTAMVTSVEHDSGWLDNIGPAPSPHRCQHVAANSDSNRRHFAHLERFFQAGWEPDLTDDTGRNWRAGLVTREFRSYAAEIMNYPRGFYHIVVVDGMARVLCAWLASQRVADDGFIVFDNSDRDIYQKAYRLLQEAGFVRIDFWGTGPLNPYEWCTSVFTRTLGVFR